MHRTIKSPLGNIDIYVVKEENNKWSYSVNWEQNGELSHGVGYWSDITLCSTEYNKRKWVDSADIALELAAAKSYEYLQKYSEKLIKEHHKLMSQYNDLFRKVEGLK